MKLNLKNTFFGSTKRKVVSIILLLLAFGFVLMGSIYIAGMIYNSAAGQVINSGVEFRDVNASLTRSNIPGVNLLQLSFKYENKNLPLHENAIDKVLITTDKQSILFPVVSDNTLIFGDGVIEIKQREYNVPGGETPLSLTIQHHSGRPDVTLDIESEDLNIAEDIYLSPFLSDVALYDFPTYITPKPTREAVNPNIQSETIAEVMLKINTFLNDPSTGRELVLEKAGLSIKLPKASTYYYYETPTEMPDYEMGGMYELDPDCETLDSSSLTLKDPKFYCKKYNLYYSVFSHDSIYAIDSTIELFIGGFPKYKIDGIVSNTTVITEKNMTINGQNYLLKKYKDSNRGDLMVIFAKNSEGMPFALEINYTGNFESIETIDPDIFWKLGEAIISSIK